MKRVKVMAVFGTRPEAIKMAPVINQLRRWPGEIETSVVSTGQHSEMLSQVLRVFAIEPDHDLAVMTANQTLAELTSRILTRLDALLAAQQPDVVLVQGDTTTVLAGSLAAFYRGIIVGHVEAGLRTGDRQRPFPEELNRVLASHLSTIHFAPTRRARQNLLAEGIQDDAIHVTGNTVIDALLWVVQSTESGGEKRNGHRRILVTAHRRENHGSPLEEICQAILGITEAHKDVDVLFPVHLNPRVRKTVYGLLQERPRITLCEPLEYLQFAQELQKADIILTDSGGIQEEAPSLGKPVLVMREETERPEGVEAGTCRLVGADRTRILDAVNRLLDSDAHYAEMANAVNPYGDGLAARRIVEILLAKFARQ